MHTHTHTHTYRISSPPSSSSFICPGFKFNNDTRVARRRRRPARTLFIFGVFIARLDPSTPATTALSRPPPRPPVDPSLGKSVASLTAYVKNVKKLLSHALWPYIKVKRHRHRRLPLALAFDLHKYSAGRRAHTYHCAVG